MAEQMKAAIQKVIQDMMDNIMEKVLITDPFIPEEHRAKKPLYAALVPDEIFKGSHFERRFVTPFGKAWEKLAVVAAEYGLGYATLNHTIRGQIKRGRILRITEVLNRLEHPLKGKKTDATELESGVKIHFSGKREIYSSNRRMRRIRRR